MQKQCWNGGKKRSFFRIAFFFSRGIVLHISKYPCFLSIVFLIVCYRCLKTVAQEIIQVYLRVCILSNIGFSLRVTLLYLLVSFRFPKVILLWRTKRELVYGTAVKCFLSIRINWFLHVYVWYIKSAHSNDVKLHRHGHKKRLQWLIPNKVISILENICDRIWENSALSIKNRNYFFWINH